MADLQKKLIILPDNPLCGISTYTDTLNLATGDCTRQIMKLVLDGTEDWRQSGTIFYLTSISPNYARVSATATYICTHFQSYQQTSSAGNVPDNTIAFGYSSSNQRLYCAYTGSDTVDAFKSYLTSQYSAGTPVTVWYVLATHTTETITVPTGLSGTEEGYLTQSETPTPTNPVYPTANEVLIWQHSLKKFDGTNWINADVKEYDGTDWQ